MRKNDFTEEQINEIIRLYTIELLGTPSIGKMFGIGKLSINKLLKEHGVVIGISGRKFKGGKTVSNKKYREKHKDEAKEYNKKYGAEYYKNNFEAEKERGAKYRKDNVEKEKKRHTKYRENNIEKIRVYRKNILTKNRRNELHKEKMLSDNLYALKHKIRTLISVSIKAKGYTKKSKIFEILGCSFEYFKHHLESQFESWMTWDNHGNPKDGILELNKTWDIDHIIPISSSVTEEDVIRLNKYTNFRPLCSYNNRFIKRNLQ